MPNPSSSKYGHQRPKVTPPHVTLRTLRIVAKLTLDQVCALVEVETGEPLTRGALSGIEGGHRGASDKILRGLASAYGIKVEDFVLDYEPKSRKS